MPPNAVVGFCAPRSRMTYTLAPVLGASSASTAWAANRRRHPRVSTPSAARAVAVIGRLQPAGRRGRSARAGWRRLGALRRDGWTLRSTDHDGAPHGRTLPALREAAL